MRFPVLVCVAFCAAVAFATSASAFSVSLRERRDAENGKFTVLDIEANGERLTAVVPRGWRPAVSAQENSIPLHSRSGDSTITMTFWAQDAEQVLASADTFRQTIVPFLPEPTVTEEAPAFTSYGPGRSVEFAFVLQGSSMRSRVVVIPLRTGYTSFTVIGPAEHWPLALQGLGGVLTSFRPAPQNPEARVTGTTRPKPPATRIRDTRQLAKAPVGTPIPGVDPPRAVAVEESLPPVRPTIFDGKEQHLLLGVVGVLLVILTARTLARHKREAEIRALTGYLSDGREAAGFEMPALFASPLPNSADERAFHDPFANEKRDEADPVKTALKEFFELAPERLAEIRQLLSNFDTAFDETERKQVLKKLVEGICTLKTKASSWDLRPVWQMSSALELLLQRLIEKTKEATPSTLRSVASAVDVLAELCVPGVRPDLIITPPISVLAVDDDPLCLRAVAFALQKADMTPDMAEDGEKAVILAAQKYYDVVFMDIQMPGIDGMEACTQIHKTPKNESTPVVFVTVRSDFRTRAESTLKGGSDLMAKPFLMFEITVKALTYAMRKRLDLQKSAHRAPGSAFVPTVLTGTASSSPATGVLPVTPGAHPVPSKAAGQATSGLTEGTTNVAADLNGDFFAKAPQFFAAARKTLAEIAAATDHATQEERLGKLHFCAQTLANKTKLSQLELAGRASTALEALVKKLHQNLKHVTPSTLNTVANAFNVLDCLCARGVEEKLAGHSPIRLLVVEDEALARRAIVGALQLAFDKADSADDGVEALNLSAQKSYDVIFSDIEMPIIGGFAFCSRIRAGNGPNRNTPVVFITSHIDFESRTQAVQSGASDFIAKPFLPIEITVKALTFALEARLRKINAGPVLVSPLTTTPATGTNPPPELLAAV